MPEPLRFGVIGTGFWGSTVHLPAAQESSAVELTAVYGRDAGRARAAAAGSSAVAVSDLADFFDLVDIVGFAVQADAQGQLAAAAIAAGKHLILEKPVAFDPGVAHALVLAAHTAGVKSLVFFTHRFDAGFTGWLEAVRLAGDWTFGRVEGFGSTLVDPSSAFHASRWRHDRGALWDVGPHAVAQLCGALGPVRAVMAARGVGDFITLILHHESGGQGSVSVAADLPRPVRSGTYLVGPAGRTEPPQISDWNSAARRAYQAAITQITAEVTADVAPHECSLDFGAHVTDVLAAAERAAASGRVETVFSSYPAR